MSIYGSFGGFDNGGEDERQPPISYRGSHILPKVDDPRSGYVSLAHIPGFIARDGNDGESDPIPFWPYLRISVGDEDDDTVVLDIHQVDTLIEDLIDWRKNADIGKLRE